MGMSREEFKAAFLKDQAERKIKLAKEYENYYSIVMYRVRKSRNYNKSANLNKAGNF